jgi:predicted PurR-regulated permease PerM
VSIRPEGIIALALVGLLIIAIVVVLYVARTLFMPIIAALVVGTMLSSGAGFLERHRIPRAASAALMVVAACGIVALIAALISSPLLKWSSQLPQLGYQLREKFHAFDGLIARWHQLQSVFGIAPSDVPLMIPKLEWVQPTLEFVSPTLTELLLFLITLILFVASWPDLRRSLIMTFAERDSRLRMLRILNATERRLGNYLLIVTMINMSIGIVTGAICAVAGLPNAAGLGALAATLNYVPIIGPVVTFAVLMALGVISSATLGDGVIASLLFAIVTFLEGHFITPTIIGRRLSLNAFAVFVAFAFWTWLWGPIGAFLASPMLIVALILKEHLVPPQTLQLPDD